MPCPDPDNAPATPAQGIQLNINPAWEVHPSEVKASLSRHADLLILDVRRQNEWDTTHLDGATLIPLDQLAARASELAPWKNRPIVVHCHHGVRSLSATALLRKLGFTNVHSMAGGIDAWSLIVDPAVRRY